MRRHLSAALLYTASLLALFRCDTAGNVEDPARHYFVKYYGGDGNQSGVDMLALQDGSFLILGIQALTAYTDIYLLRVDAEGAVMWEKKITGNTPEYILTARDLEKTGDGNFVVLTDFRENIGAQTDVKLYKISPEGAILDSIAFGTGKNDFSKSVTLLSDGGFIVSGYTESTTQSLDPGDAFNYRIDQNLQLVPGNDWGPVIHGFGAQEGTQVDVAVRTMEVSDPHNPGQYRYYVFGYTNSNLNNTNPNRRFGLFYFLRGSSGTPGQNYYPGNVVSENDTEIHFVDKVPAEMGNGFVVVGSSRNNVNVSGIFLARFQASLTFAPPRQNDAPLYITVPLQRNVRGVAATSSLVGEYGYLVLGNEVRQGDITNIWLSKVNQNGSVLWSVTFGSEQENDSGAAVMQLPDGKIVVLGTVGLADNQSKIALMKLNPQGQLLK